jgi:hypothetical protein
MKMVTYIFEKGQYSRRSTELVTNDVKKVAKLYTDSLKNGELDSAVDDPNIQIWKDERHLRDFFDNESNEQKVIKALSKIGMEIK